MEQKTSTRKLIEDEEKEERRRLRKEREERAERDRIKEYYQLTNKKGPRDEEMGLIDRNHRSSVKQLDSDHWSMPS